MTQQAKGTYNGWANYETWLVHLWISNDGDAYVHTARLLPVEEHYERCACDAGGVAVRIVCD